ncbi:MAG: ATP-grasp domain-containing protein [Saprospiraceae bacterium]|nr:ATP-grasp domain-containing protein [Saprospiraceae bacterium]
MKLVYLYTRSELTPWKENVNEETLAFLKVHTPAGIQPEVLHFEGFDDEMLNQLRKYDLVFNLCYGYKDAGQVEVAAWLEHNGIPHTASSFGSMTKAQDKSLLPDICAGLNLSTPDIYYDTELLNDHQLYIAKPRKGSCHRNISIETGVWMKTHLEARKNDLIIQPYISGREFSVGVIPRQDGNYYLALPPVEIEPMENMDVYIAGNSFGKTSRNLSPFISDDLEEDLMYQAEILHKTIGLKTMSRTDFRVSKDGTIYVLDVNAMPNLDPDKSLMPALCLHHGVSVTELIKRIVKNHEYTRLQTINNYRQKIYTDEYLMV